MSPTYTMPLTHPLSHQPTASLLHRPNNSMLNGQSNNQLLDDGQVFRGSHKCNELPIMLTGPEPRPMDFYNSVRSRQSTIPRSIHQSVRLDSDDINKDNRQLIKSIKKLD